MLRHKLRIPAGRHGKQLAESERKYRRLVENLGKDYFLPAHARVFDYLSPSITSALGYSQKEFHPLQRLPYRESPNKKY